MTIAIPGSYSVFKALADREPVKSLQHVAEYVTIFTKRHAAETTGISN